ncbi:MAG: signal peptidase I [Actinobacteria bacterium]|nr:signal peptidase I [Actinomycetota bacterium]
MAIIAYLAWPSQWGGSTTYVVVKGTSMRPNYRTGDIVIARKADEHHVGDVVVYAVPEEYNGAGKLIMHRLKSIQPDGQYIIQGDNRDSPDDFVVRSDDVVGVAKLHIPRLGLFFKILGQWWFIAGLAGMFIFLRLWPEDVEDDDDGDATADAAGAGPAGGREPALVGAPRVDGSDRRSGVDRRGPDRPPDPIGELARKRVEPVAPPAPTRAHVIVDGDGLARAGWPTASIDVARLSALDAADEIGHLFGTSVAVVLPERIERSGPHAYVEAPPDGDDVAAVVRALVSAHPASTTVLVVTDELAVADDAWAVGASVMRCASWLSLGRLASSASG